MRAMVMPLWSCGYFGHAYQLERKLHGGRGEKNGEEQERRKRQQTKVNIHRIFKKAILHFPTDK